MITKANAMIQSDFKQFTINERLHLDMKYSIFKACFLHIMHQISKRIGNAIIWIKWRVGWSQICTLWWFLDITSIMAIYLSVPHIISMWLLIAFHMYHPSTKLLTTGICCLDHGAWGSTHLGPTGPRRAPCWPQEPCYLGIPGQFCITFCEMRHHYILMYFVHQSFMFHIFNRKSLGYVYVNSSILRQQHTSISTGMKHSLQSTELRCRIF